MNLFTALALVCFVIAAIALFASIGTLAVALGIISVGLACTCLAGHYGPKLG